MRVRRPLRARLQASALLAVLAFGFVNILLVGRVTYTALRSEQERRLAFVTKLLAQRAVRPLLLDDRVALLQLVDESRTLDPDLVFLAVVGPRGTVLASSATPEGESWLAHSADRHRPAELFQEGLRVAEAPVLGGQLGTVLVGISERTMRAALTRVVGIISLMVIAFLAAGMAVAAALAHSLTRRIGSLVEFAARVNLDEASPALPLDSHDEIAALGTQLAAMAERLKRLHEATRRQEREMARVEQLVTVGTLAAGVAHEINNPLAGIRTAIERLLRHVPPPDAPRYGTVLRDAVARIERAVRGLLEFARAGEVTMGPVAVPEAVEQSLRLASPRLEERRISVVHDLPPELPLALADGGQLRQVMVNLILNACDAMPQGGVLTIRGGTAERRLWLEVADTGCGVPENLGERIFLPFVTSKPPGVGTGLGLAVSRAAIREMGGELQLVPVPSGACFRIELELAR